MESAAGREVANNGGHFGPMKVDGTPAFDPSLPAALRHSSWKPKTHAR
jgi:hypothetical protein